ncbi:MAG: 5'-methylthioadenosine/adenosylhomocysteine nucleosidase [Variovorax sp.]
MAILSALPEEQQGLADLLDNARASRHAGRALCSGQLRGEELLLALSGVGKVSAATTATLLIERFDVRAIVFTGVAGGLAGHVKVGDIVIADALLQHDIDASPLFPRFEVPYTGRSRFPVDAALTARLAAAAEAWCAEVRAVGVDRAMPAVPIAIDAEVVESFALQQTRPHRGLLIAGDRFVASATESSALRQALPDALAVDMESAAVAQVCWDYGVPFAAMRTVSDRADDAAHVDFPAFLAEVAGAFARGVIGRMLKITSPCAGNTASVRRR